MRRYWEIDQTFAQPSESLLKKNLKESVKKQKEKGNTSRKKKYLGQKGKEIIK